MTCVVGTRWMRCPNPGCAPKACSSTAASPNKLKCTSVGSFSKAKRTPEMVASGAKSPPMMSTPIRIDGLKLSSCVDDYFALVVHLALKPVGTVVQMRLTGSWTSSYRWGFCLVVGSSLVSSAPRVAVFWIWHLSLTLNSSVSPSGGRCRHLPPVLRCCHQTSASEFQSLFDSCRYFRPHIQLLRASGG